MCKCITKVPEKLKETVYPDTESVYLKDFEMMTGRFYATAVVKLKVQKKPINVPILASFCPFCGERYAKEDHRGEPKE